MTSIVSNNPNNMDLDLLSSQKGQVAPTLKDKVIAFFTVTNAVGHTYPYLEAKVKVDEYEKTMKVLEKNLLNAKIREFNRTPSTLEKLSHWYQGNSEYWSKQMETETEQFMVARALLDNLQKAREKLNL